MDDGVSSYSPSAVPTCASAETFFAWREAIEPVLVGIRALEIVRGEEQCPTLPSPPTSTDFRMVESWKDRNAKAMSLIRRTVGGAYSGMIRGIDSAHGMWELMRLMVKLNNLTTSDHRSTISWNLANLFLHEGQDMVEHLNKFMALVAEADAAGLSWGQNERKKCDRFFDTLPCGLKTVKTKWRQLDKSDLAPSLAQASRRDSSLRPGQTFRIFNSFDGLIVS